MLSFLFSSKPTPLEEAETKVALLGAENDRLRKQVQDYHDALRRAEHEVTLWKIRCEKTEESLEQVRLACFPVLHLREQFVQSLDILEETLHMNELEELNRPI